jgi:hypothetical protein
MKWIYIKNNKFMEKWYIDACVLLWWLYITVRYLYVATTSIYRFSYRSSCFHKTDQITPTLFWLIQKVTCSFLAVDSYSKTKWHGGDVQRPVTALYFNSKTHGFAKEIITVYNATGHELCGYPSKTHSWFPEYNCFYQFFYPLFKFIKYGNHTIAWL